MSWTSGTEMLPHLQPLVGEGHLRDKNSHDKSDGRDESNHVDVSGADPEWWIAPQPAHPINPQPYPLQLTLQVQLNSTLKAAQGGSGGKVGAKWERLLAIL